MLCTLPEHVLVMVVGDAHAATLFAARYPETVLFAAEDAPNLDAPLKLLKQRLAAGGPTFVAGSAFFERSFRQQVRSLAREYYLPSACLVAVDDPDIVRLVKHEGYREVLRIQSSTALEQLQFVWQPLVANQRSNRGPFDIIGDVHGCFDELVQLLERLEYKLDQQDGRFSITHPQARQLVFVGDLVDRGPKTPQVLRCVMDLVRSGAAWTVLGNHDDRLRRSLAGNKVKIQHGLAESLEQLASTSPQFKREICDFLAHTPVQYVFDAGKLAVSHAGLPTKMHGREGKRIRARALYGKTANKLDADGLPVRLNWQVDYHGSALVVYGHTPVLQPLEINNSINIDTGCVFGGKLTALRYPEREYVAVPAQKAYAQALRWPPKTERQDG